MGQFFKFMFASMLGFFLSMALILVVFFIVLFGAIAAAGSAFSFGDGPTTVKDNSVLLMKLDQEIVDRGPKDDMMFNFPPFNASSRLGLNDILEDLEKAKHDDRIKGIFMDLSMVNARMATMQEIREKVIEFKKESGKKVIAYGEVMTQGTYYLASAADEIYLVPEGDLDFRGLRTEMMFFKGTFEKLGIDVQFIRGSNNQFKSFGEAFTEDHMSEKNREQMTVLVNGLWDHYLTSIGDSRKLDKTRVNEIAENLLIKHAPDAVTVGLIDGVKYRDEVLALVKDRMGLPKEKEIEFTSLPRYTRSFVAKKDKKDDGDKKERSSKKPVVAVIYAQGDIMSGESDDETIGSATIAEAIREAREDSTVKAIVLRVNSPGGSGLASDVIWREVTLAKQSKPVVVSMGDLAASGGYYISCAADKIYAEPTTITGSIGVFGIIPNMKGFFNDKLGITFDGVKTNKYADMITTTRPLSEEEKSIIQGYVDRFYDTFKKRVADGRHMPEAYVDSIGQGRVWTGVMAKELGLVDELGGLEDAIKSAAQLAKIDSSDYRTIDYPEQKKFLEQLKEDLNGEAKTWVRSEVFGDDVELLKQFEAVRKTRTNLGVQARMPFELEVH